MIAKWALQGILACWTILSFCAIASEPCDPTATGTWGLWELCAFISLGLSCLAWRLADRRGWLPKLD